jgi:hypothetical protein
MRIVGERRRTDYKQSEGWCWCVARDLLRGIISLGKTVDSEWGGGGLPNYSISYRDHHGYGGYGVGVPMVTRRRSQFGMQRHKERRTCS